MVEHQDMQLTLRARLKTLSVCTTGSTDLEAVADDGDGHGQYVRPSGSFITDGLQEGMEVAGTGFSGDGNNNPSTVLEVAALTLTVDRTLTTEAEGSGRTLAVGLPSRRAWENIKFDPEHGAPYVEEQYIPGPSTLLTTKDGGTIEVEPQYAVHVHVPAESGIGASNGYADAILALFPPGHTMTLTNGDTLRVRADTGPFPGQLLQRKPGWATRPVTIACRLFTLNA